MIYIVLSYLFSPLIYLFVAINKDKEIKKILIIQTAKIGDMICSTPVFREVKKKYPHAHLSAMIDPVTKELLEYNPHVDEIITIKNNDYKGFSGKMYLSHLIRRGKYDIAICLNPSIPYAVALFWGLVPVRLSVKPDFTGSTFKLASALFTRLEKHVRGELTAETYMKMLRPIGIMTTNISKEVYRAKGSDEKVLKSIGAIEKPMIGIAVSSGNKMKELSAEKIAALTSKMLECKDICVVLIGSAQDMNLADIISEKVEKKESIINMAGRLSLAELPALIERLSLFIGVDSGITYMADALSIPLINIAGPADMQDQRPTGENAVIIQKKLDCVPCSHAFKSPYHCRLNTRECITSVSVEEIYFAVEKIMAGS